jgi:hypothetical protein
MAKSKNYDGPAVRLGSFGDLQKEGQAIEDYQRPPGSHHGPFMCEYITNGMFKIMHDPSPCREQVCAGHGTFGRYADAEQIGELYNLLREQRFEEFEEMALSGGMEHTQPKYDGQETYGPLSAECHWIVTHDDTKVFYSGSNIQWPNGCWVVEKEWCDRQLVDPEGIKYIAHNILGMPQQEKNSDLPIVAQREPEADEVWDIEGDEDIWDSAPSSDYPLTQAFLDQRDGPLTLQTLADEARAFEHHWRDDPHRGLTTQQPPELLGVDDDVWADEGEADDPHDDDNIFD